MQDSGTHDINEQRRFSPESALRIFVVPDFLHETYPKHGTDMACNFCHQCEQNDKRMVFLDVMIIYTQV